MFWSPVVREGRITKELSQIEGLQIIVNADYTERIQGLKDRARLTTRDTGNPFFRVLQVLVHRRQK